VGWTSISARMDSTTRGVISYKKARVSVAIDTIIYFTLIN
jgi:hypothetical protein